MNTYAQEIYRAKTSTGWSSWRRVTTTEDAVSKSGDTMTGNLTIQRAAPHVVLDDTAAGAVGQVLADSHCLAMQALNVSGNPTNRRQITVYDSNAQAAVANAAAVVDVVNGVATVYTLLHTGNKSLLSPSDIGAAATEHKHTTDEITGLSSALSGVAKSAIGSYTGTGTYGEDNPNSLTFPGTPRYVHVLRTTSGVSGQFEWIGQSGNVGANQYSRNGNTLSWYGVDAAKQCNEDGVTYRYFAIYK